jgi:hypothetical protein
MKRAVSIRVQGAVMSDGSKSMPGGEGALGVASFMMALPTPCALVGAGGRVERVNAAWASKAHALAALAAPGADLIGALAALPEGEAAATGLRDVGRGPALRTLLRRVRERRRRCVGAAGGGRATTQGARAGDGG